LWFRVVVGVWALTASYDTFSGVVSQLSPKTQIPALGPLLVGSSHLLPWWGWLLVLQTLIILSLAEYVVHHMERLEVAMAALPANMKPERFTEDDQAALVERLQKLRGASQNPFTAKVQYGSSPQRFLANRLADLFERAGWSKNYYDTGQAFKGSYPAGLWVKGFNGSLVQGVARALTDAGLRDVRTEVLKNEIDPSNPKHPMTIGMIYLTVGQPEEISV